MKNEYFAEAHNVKVGAPIGTDMNTAAITGARVSLKNFERVAILVEMGTSTAAVASFTLRQHNAASSGTSKDITGSKSPYYVKAGSAEVYTKVQPDIPAGFASATFDLSTTFAAASGQVIFEVLAEDLDVDNSFAWVSLDVADSTAAKVISIKYIMIDPRQGPAYAMTSV